MRKLIVKSSTLVYGAGKRDPYFFREDMDRTTPARTEVERSLLETSAFVRDFAPRGVILSGSRCTHDRSNMVVPCTNNFMD